MTLAVDPITSLIDDQTRRLREDGIDRVEPLHRAALAKGVGEEAFLRLAGGDSLFAFCSPERLQTASFRSSLRAAARKILVNLAVIDEAHCVSEWGHDFRTSYLLLGKALREYSQDDTGQPPPFLALTGTASPAVRRDVVRLLAINPDAPGAIQRPKDFDRPNLYYVIQKGTSRKPLIRNALTEVIPATLGIDPASLQVLAGSQTRSGLIFCAHINGKWGVKGVVEEVKDVLGAPPVDIYSGDAPKDWVGDWSQHKAEVAERFCRDEVLALVATKAFGMGIDKPNISWTIHIGFPGSLEAFAQEAGRAGRDGRQAACVLNAHPPSSAAAERILRPELSTKERWKLHEDGLASDSDLGRQLFFLARSFPSEEQEVQDAVAVWNELVRLGAEPEISLTVPWGRGEDLRSSRERAIYRLVLVGAIVDYTVDFGAGTFSVELSRLDAASLDSEVLGYLGRVEVGRSAAHLAEVARAPAPVHDRVAFHLRLVIAATYRTVVPARIYALREMYRLSISGYGNDSIRSTINSYLSDGPLATLLAEALERSVPDIGRLIVQLDAMPPADPFEWAGAAQRQIESFGQHPALLVVRTLGEAWLPDGSRSSFSGDAGSTFEALATYLVPETEAKRLLAWMLAQLRNVSGGRRWSWASDLWNAWDRSGYADQALESLEDQVLNQALAGRYHPSEVASVGSRRTRRLAALAAQYAKQMNDLEGR